LDQQPRGSSRQATIIEGTTTAPVLAVQSELPRTIPSIAASRHG
jgi:hypothetical protein